MSKATNTVTGSSKEITNSSTDAGNYNKIVNKNKNNQVIDYTKHHFEYLIKNIEIKVLKPCLAQILSFLDSDKLELEFYGITMHLKEILIRIVKNVDVLKTSAMFYSCREICKNIVMKVNSNVEIYFLACFYKQEVQNCLGGNSNNILVYKKMYHASILNHILTNSSQSPSPPFRSSNLESVELQKLSHGESPSSTDYFKIQSLNLILNFVKDKNRKSLVFSDLTTRNADFVHSIFKSIIDDCVHVKKKCPQLWEAVKIFSLKYNFSIKYLDNTSNKVSLLLEKMEKDNTSATEDFDLNPESCMSVTNKSLKKHKELIQYLPQDFILTSLKKFDNFLKNEAEASLLFANVNSKYARFLCSIINYCRSSNIKMMFTKEARQLFNDIQYSVAMKVDYKIKLKQTNIGGGDKIIRYLKMPVYVKRAPESRSWYPLESTNDGGSKCEKVDIDIAPTKSDETAPTTSGHKYGMHIDFKYAGELGNGRSNESSLVLERERDCMLTKALKKHTASILDTQLERIKGIKGRRSSACRQPRTSQLIEALSVPVKSDKALKMMLDMGWNGGALGSRGDGITEPLMPDLNTVAGVGLGHIAVTKPNIELPKAPPSIPTITLSCNKKDAVKFRKFFLTQLLELLTSSEDTKTIKLYPMLKKKEKSFMRHSLRCFAGRMPLKMSDDEQGLVDKIMAQYIKDPELVVFACDDNKEIVLKKTHSEVTPVNRKEYTIPPEITDNELYPDNVQRILDSFGPLYQKKKTFEKTKFRVTILLELLRFIKNIFLDETEVKFDKEMTVKQIYYVEGVINNINKRLKFGATGGETAMSREIKKYMGDFNLILEINQDLMSFRVTKQYVSCKSDKTNTATMTTIKKRKPTDYSYIKDLNDDLYNKDDIDISDDVKKTQKLSGTVYKSQVINENYDDYDNNMSDYNDFDNYSDIEGSLNENEKEKIHKNNDIIIKYEDNLSITNNTEKSTENTNITEKSKENTNITEKSKENTNITEKSKENTNITEKTTVITNVIQSIEHKTNHIFDNLTTTDNSKGNMIEYNRLNKSTTIQTTPKINLDSENNYKSITIQTTPKINLDSENNYKFGSNDKINISDSDDKMNISDSNDYSVLKIDDISMCEDNITDWDESQSDVSIKSNNQDESVPKLAEIKKKQLKKNINKINTYIKIVSLNKRPLLSENLLKHIQHIISYNILKSDKYPLLKCYGVQNGLVIYSCHNKKSYEWLLEICLKNDIVMVDKCFNKMSFKINWFYDENDNYAINMLDLYNDNIKTDEWSVIKREKLGDNLLYVVKMDKESFDFILKSDLTLYAGVDKIQFSVVWE